MKDLSSLFYVCIILIFCCSSCRPNSEAKHGEQTFFTLEEVTKVDTPLFNPDTAGYLLQLPMGNRKVFKRWKTSDQVAELYDSYQINQNFCDSFLCGKTIIYDSIIFKEAYYEDVPMYIYNVAPDAIISKKMLLKNDHMLFFICIGSGSLAKIFLFSVKNNQLIDSKAIYYHHEGESGYTTGRLFYIDKDCKISLRKYSFREEGLLQSPLTQWILNTEGWFVQYYDRDGLYQTKEEKGMVKNHLREGLWIEKKANGMLSNLYPNHYIENRYTYLEAEFQAGIPVGEWRFYRLGYKYGKDPLSGVKGELAYREIYENGKMVKRILNDDFKGDEEENTTKTEN